MVMRIKTEVIDRGEFRLGCQRNADCVSRVVRGLFWLAVACFKIGIFVHRICMVVSGCGRFVCFPDCFCLEVWYMLVQFPFLFLNR